MLSVVSVSMGTHVESRGRLTNSPPEARARRAFWLVGGGILAVWGGHNGWLSGWEIRHVGAAAREPALVLLRALCWFVPIAWYLRRYESRGALAALGVTSRCNARGLAWSLLVASAYLFPVGLLVRSSAPPGHDLDVVGTFASPHALYQGVTIAMEELLMRGFLLRQLVRFASPLRAQVVVAALFAGMHLPGWIALEGIGFELVPSTIMVLVLGGVLGVVARAGNNIILAFLVHFSSNMLAELYGSG